MADSRAEAESYKMSLEYLVVWRVRKCSKNNGDRSKRHEVSLKCLPLAKYEAI